LNHESRKKGWNLETRNPGNLIFISLSRFPDSFWIHGFQIFDFVLKCPSMADDRW